jgi:hypothetical protein
MLEYLELAQLMQYSLHHPEGFVVVSTPAPDLIHSQAHEVVMDAHQQHVQIQLLHVVKGRPLVPAECNSNQDGSQISNVLPMLLRSLPFAAANFCWTAWN